MPFGIPPTDPRPAAALDYCDATTDELVGLFETIVEPINLHITEIDAALAQLMGRLKNVVGRHFGAMDRDFDLLTSDLHAYVNTLSGWYESQLDQQSQLMDVGISLLPPSQREQLFSVSAPVTVSSQISPANVTEIRYGPTGLASAVPPPGQAGGAGALAAQPLHQGVAAPLSAVVRQPSAKAQSVTDILESVRRGETDVRVLQESILAGQGLTGVLPGTVRFPDVNDPDYATKSYGWLLEQQRLHREAAVPRQPPAPGVSAPAEQYKLPPRPSYDKGPPCPRLPKAIEGLGAPMGSQLWCEAVDQLLDWLDDTGKQLVQWAEGSIQPEKWADWIKTFHAPDDAYQWVKDTVDALKNLLATAVSVGGNALLYASGAIQCLWYYSQVVTPIKRSGAYVGLLFVRNILDWLRASRIGSQSYLGFTLSTAITIPSLSRTVDALLDYLVPVEVPSIVEVRNAWLKGYIRDEKQVECLMRLNGLNPNLWWTFLRADQEQLSPEEALEYARRKGGDVDSQVEALRQLGYTDARIARARVELYDKFPSIADHLHFLTRNVHDDAYVRDYHLMDGFTERFWSKFGSQLRALGMTQEIAGLHYAAHWLQPSPHELREFVYRLRPGRDKSGLEFSEADYTRLLAEKDISPLAAQWFKATLYHVPALSYLRDMHRMDLLTDDEMREYHADLGYSAKDSELFVRVDTYRKRRMRASQGGGWSPSALRRAAIVGQVTDEFVRERMTHMGYSTEDATDLLARAKSEYQYRALSRSLSTQITTITNNVRQALTVGVMGADDAVTTLTALGWDQTRARGIADTQLAMGRVQRVRQAVSSIRGAYLRGEIDSAYVLEVLAKLGLTAEATEGYLVLWDAANTPHRKRRTAAQTAKDLAAGELTEEEARVKLRNLRYESDDIELWLAQAARQKGSVYHRETKKRAGDEGGMEELPGPEIPVP